MSFRNIVFFGSDEIAMPLLEALTYFPNAKISGIVSQPDRPAGRGKKIRANPVSLWAKANDIPLIQPEKLDDKAYEWLAYSNIQVGLVMSYGLIIPKRFLGMAPLGFLNFHTSLLPKYRGASPINASILNGDLETGVSLMKLVPRMDAGPILDAEKVAIDANETSISLKEKLSVVCPVLLERNWYKIINQSAHYVNQDDDRATYVTKLNKYDGFLDFNLPAVVLERKVRGLQPWPGTYFNFKGNRLKIDQASVEFSEEEYSPGLVIRREDGSIVVGTVEGGLKLEQLQRPGGKMLPAKVFLQGFDIPAGTVITKEEDTIFEH